MWTFIQTMVGNSQDAKLTNLRALSWKDLMKVSYSTILHFRKIENLNILKTEQNGKYTNITSNLLLLLFPYSRNSLENFCHSIERMFLFGYRTFCKMCKNKKNNRSRASMRLALGGFRSINVLTSNYNNTKNRY